MSQHNLVPDFAITLVRNEAEGTILDAHDLKYVHKQLMTNKREKLRGETEFPNHVNKPSRESLDRCFEEVPYQRGQETLHKLVYYSAKETAEVCRGEREFAHVLWVKVAPVEEFGE
jgi:hypothetical protein